MTKVEFENATIRDVIGKAARVAPTKGSAFEKSNGIVFDVDPQGGEVVVRSTNGEVFYMEIADTVSIEGPARTWRLPSTVLDGICSKLPIRSGNTVVFDDNNTAEMLISSGRMRARLRLADPTYFPTWEAFDPSELSPVADFGARIQQVQWAASKENLPPWTGVNISSTHIGATDRFRIALTPCDIPHLVSPVTVPATIFNSLMKTLGEVRIGQEHGMLLVMPDETTQIRAVIFDGKYPDLNAMLKRNEPAAVMVKKTALIEMIERAMVMGQRDRTPLIKCYIGEEEFAVAMEERELGLLGDVLDLPGQCIHERALICFTPTNLTSALNACPNEDVTFWYSPTQPMKPVRLDGGSGYEVLIMPRKENSEGE